MRAHFVLPTVILSLTAFMIPGVAIGQANLVRQPPVSCTCSPAILASSKQDAENSVYVANCWCPPQNCAATWNSKLKYGGISLACSPGNEAPLPESNCIDYFKLPPSSTNVGIFKSGGITATASPSSSIRQAEIRNVTTGVVELGPTGLLAQSSTYALSGPANRIEITYSSGLAGGFLVEWVNDFREFKTENPTGNPQAKILKTTISDANGLNWFKLSTTEVFILQVCAYFDPPVAAPAASAKTTQSHRQ